MPDLGRPVAFNDADCQNGGPHLPKIAIDTHQCECHYRLSFTITRCFRMREAETVRASVLLMYCSNIWECQQHYGMELVYIVKSAVFPSNS
jgi:hypothetical protein